MTELESKKNENVHKEQIMTIRTKDKKSDDYRDNKSFCQIILQNLIKISTKAYKLEPFKSDILVKFDFWGQRSCFEKSA